MKKIFMIILAAVLGIVIVSGHLSLVIAQDEFTLEEITVTAQKREENQQKVGIAMEVYSSEYIKELGRYDVDSILSTLANAVIQRSVEGLRVGIRGVTFDTPAGYGDGTGAVPATVDVNLDGIMTGRRPTGTGLYDIERVEVLFGPQSTMYSSYSPGGLININYAKPKLEDYETSGTLEYGNYDLLRGEGVVNAPVSESIALRAAFHYQVRNGYLSNGADDEDAKSGRLRALFKPNEKFNILLTGEYETSSNRMMSSVPGFTDQDDVADPWHSDEVLTGLPTRNQKNKYWLNLEYDFGWGVATLIGSTSDEDYYRTSSSVEDDGTTSELTSQGWGWEDIIEARIVSSDDSRIKWIIGYNSYQSELFRDQYRDYLISPDTQSEFFLLMDMQAILGNIKYPLTDQFRIVAGARRSDDRAMSTRTIIAGFGRDTVGDQRFEGTDYKIGIEYDIGESSMFFADFQTSHRVKQEGMTWRGTTNPPEQGDNYQAGIKNRFFGNKLQVNGSAYYYTFTNRAFQAMNFASFYMSTGTYCDPAVEAPGTCMRRPDEGGRLVGDYRVYGADIQTSWIVTPQDKLDVSFSWSDSWITKLIADWEFKDQPYSSQYDFSNSPPTFTPEFTVSLNYNHNFNLPNGGTITGRFDTRYQTKYKIDWWDYRGGTDQTAYIWQEGHHIDNVTFVYASPDGKWTLTGYIKNMWNYAEKRRGDRTSMTIGPPRTYGGIITVRY